MSTLDQGVQQAEVLTDNLSAIAAQNQEANRSANLEVSSVEQLADSNLSNAQALGQLNNFASITTSSTTTTTSSSSTTALTLAAAQTSAAQQNERTYNSGSCCCFDETVPEVLEVTLEDVGIRYGYDAFNQWESEIYAFVIGRVSINIALGGSFIVLMNFGGQDFEVVIPSPLKSGGPGWYAAVVDVDDPWPPPYHQVFAKGTSLNQQFFCESKTLSVTGYRLGDNPFDIFDKRVSEVELPEPVELEVCPYLGTITLQKSETDGEITATVSVDNLPFIFPLEVGVAYGDVRWRADRDPFGAVNWIWEAGGTAPAEPVSTEVVIPPAAFRYFNQYGNPTNSSSNVFWAWDPFSKEYQLQVILLDWRWNGEWEYVGPRWSNYYTDVTLWEDDYEPPSPYGGPPTYEFPDPAPVAGTLTIPTTVEGDPQLYVAYASVGGYTYVYLPERPVPTGITVKVISGRRVDASSFFINANVQGLTGKVTKVLLTLDITKESEIGFTFNQEMAFDLYSPAGTMVNVLLPMSIGGTSRPIGQSVSGVLVFGDEFENSFSPVPDNGQLITGPPLVSGNYKPAQPFSTFNGQAGIGNWRIKCIDTVDLDDLIVNSISITVFGGGT